MNEWYQILEHGGDIGAIFFDIRKAFDSVPHQPLLDKLHRYELDPHIISWVRSYLLLTDRQQHVHVSGYASSNIQVLSGVPQGSVLDPLLFLIYVDDVFLTHLSPDSALTLFADDTLLYKPIKCCEDYHHLQEDIDSIIIQLDSPEQLHFNDTKSKFMLISRRKKTTKPPQLHLNDRPIEQVFVTNILELLSHQTYHGCYMSTPSAQGQQKSQVCCTDNSPTTPDNSPTTPDNSPTTPAVRPS